MLVLHLKIKTDPMLECVDELETLLSKYGSLKKLYFYHQHLTTVFRNTMFGPKVVPNIVMHGLVLLAVFPNALPQLFQKSFIC
ncbi:Protein NAP1 [Olea europaea subsp. europaea]|uniref:Protein NAP1 n=1 Tax=Olea europaea subsp. europaea TaxID=158383 RepID=A0A8S0SW04_OLEEU|nr:Protein NAP1 [Olea europaea subsp. europaea]